MAAEVRFQIFDALVKLAGIVHPKVVN